MVYTRKKVKSSSQEDSFTHGPPSWATLMRKKVDQDIWQLLSFRVRSCVVQRAEAGQGNKAQNSHSLIISHPFAHFTIVLLSRASYVTRLQR